ncbi:MAG TPA: phage holin family protein [Terriglobales bacterium]|nr:phage holin family protein [Terriglobales bacterium]
MQVATENRSIGQVVAELKADARDFVSTRLQMLTQEMNDKVKVWKVAVPMLAVAAVIAVIAVLTLTFAIVAFFAAIFQPNPYAWCYGALIVTAIYFLVGGGLYYLGRRELTQIGLAPTRTMRVLKEDQLWIQNEARSQA